MWKTRKKKKKKETAPAGVGKVHTVCQVRELPPVKSASSTKDETAPMEEPERRWLMGDNVKRPTHLDASSTPAMGKETLEVATRVQTVSTGTHDCAMSQSGARNVQEKIAHSST